MRSLNRIFDFAQSSKAKVYVSGLICFLLQSNYAVGKIRVQFGLLYFKMYCNGSIFIPLVCASKLLNKGCRINYCHQFRAFSLCAPGQCENRVVSGKNRKRTGSVAGVASLRFIPLILS